MTVFATIVVALLAVSLGTVGLAALDETYNFREVKVLTYFSSLPAHKKASLAALLGVSCFIVLGLVLRGF